MQVVNTAIVQVGRWPYLRYKMKSEKLKQILDTDFRTNEGKQVIQDTLHKIKPLTKCEGDIPLQKIEKLISLLSRKYNVGVQQINLSTIPNNVDVYKATLCTFNSFEQIGVVYGCCVYELYAKIAILLYDKTRHMEVSHET